MADQNKIDIAGSKIAELIDKARKELITDLTILGKEIANNEQFVAALNDLDIAETLRRKVLKATSSYTVAHREVLESTIQFATLKESTLMGYLTLNQDVFDKTVINTVAAHIRNEVAKGVLAGVPAEFIAEAVASASISTAQIETLVNTTLNSYSRTITNTMMDIAPEDTKYHYIGPVDGRTRDACIRMVSAGEITRDEILKFGADVLTIGGGFNCRHKWEVAPEGGSEFYKKELGLKAKEERGL